MEMTENPLAPLAAYRRDTKYKDSVSLRLRLSYRQTITHSSDVFDIRWSQSMDYESKMNISKVAIN
jgi:hypothetical protein